MSLESRANAVASATLSRVIQGQNSTNAAASTVEASVKSSAEGVTTVILANGQEKTAYSGFRAVVPGQPATVVGGRIFS